MVVSHTCLDCVSMHKCISLWGWYMRCNISTYCMSEDCKCRITVKNCSLSGTWMATIAQLPRIGGPQSLSPLQLIVQSCPVSCEMCSCSFALHLPACVCLHLIDIYWQITPQNCSAARAKASTVCLFAHAPLAFCSTPHMIMVCWSLHWLMMWTGIITLLFSLAPWECW